MPGTTLDRWLAVLVVALAGTGLASLWFGRDGDAWLFVVHAVLAGSLALAVVLKVRASVPRATRARRYGRLGLGLVVTGAAAASLAGGYLWAVSGSVPWVDVPWIGRWTVLTLHAWVGLALVPLVAVHLLPRRWRLLRPSLRRSRTAGPGRSGVARVSRRSVLAAGALGVVGVGLAGATRLLELGTAGARRFTGSRWLPAGSLPIPTTFLGEPTPSVDPATWRLTVTDGRTTRRYAIEELRALGEVETRAVLDCTSGWAVDARWRGVPLLAVLADAGLLEPATPSTARVAITSVTGWATSLQPADAARALLAWSVEDRPLPLENGAPVRLVAPERRGLEWVKWVDVVRLG